MEVVVTLLVVLFLLLAGVTVVGHAIWVLLARLFGSAGRPQPRSGDLGGARAACPRCLVPLPADGDGCGACGWPRELGRIADREAARTALLVQVDRLLAAGVLDREAHGTITSALATLSPPGTDAPAEVLVEGLPPVPSVGQFDPVGPSAARAISEETRDSVTAPEPSVTPPPTVRPSIGERAVKYAARRAAALAVPRSEEVTPSPPASPPRERFARLFAAFMEEKNIRWGELVGGLLIVGCSLALVISFWSEIAERPLLKFGLLGGVTAALFGMGIYTDRRWRIHTTSHAILVIASLLVPLNFLAIAAFTRGAPSDDVLSLVGEGASLALFTWLVFLAGRILVPGGAGLIVAAIMLPSLILLVSRRFDLGGSPLALQYALALPTIAAYLGANFIYLLAGRYRATAESGAVHSVGAETEESHSPKDSERAPMPGEMSDIEAHRLFRFLGLSTASAGIALALLVARVGPVEQTLHWLSPLGIALGLPALSVGLWFWTRLRRPDAGGLRTAGVTIGVFGILLMAASVVLAWPDPATLLPTALVAAIVFSVVALGFGIAELHVPATLALGAGWLVAIHYAQGSVAWTLDDYRPLANALLSSMSGKLLMPLVAALLAGAFWFRRLARLRDARMLALGGGLWGAASLGLVAWYGLARPGDPQNIAWVLGVYAAAMLIAATRIDRSPVVWGAVGLLLAALAQTIVYRYGESWQLHQPWTTTLLSLATIGILLKIAIETWRGGEGRQFREALGWSALGASFGAFVSLGLGIRATPPSDLAVHGAWLAAVWLVLAFVYRSPVIFGLSQASGAGAIFLGMVPWLASRPWYVDSAHPWLDPRFLQAQGIALGGFCLAFDLLRRTAFRARSEGGALPSFARPRSKLRRIASRLLHPSWVPVDEVLEGVLVFVVTLVALYAALPGAAQELSPTRVARGTGAAQRIVTPIERFEIVSIPHHPAAEYGTWIFGAIVLTALSLSDRRFHRINPRYGALAIAALILCALAAQRWEAEVAVASALRWFSAGALLALSVPIWFRPGANDAHESAVATSYSQRGDARDFRDFLVTLLVLLYCAMGGFVIWEALRISNPRPDFGNAPIYSLVWALVGSLVAVVLMRSAASSAAASGTQGTGLRRGLAPAAGVSLFLALAPITVAFAFFLAQSLDQHPIVGPEPGTWFRQIGWDVSYGIPLGLIAVVLAGYAVRDRSSAYAFGAGMLIQVVATVVLLIRVARAGGALDAVAWMSVIQLNALVAGLVAIAWMAVRRLAERRSAIVGEGVAIAGSLLLVTQVALACALCVAFLAPSVWQIVTNVSTFVPNWASAGGAPLAWGAAASAGSAALLLLGRRGATQWTIGAVSAALVSLVALVVVHRGGTVEAGYNVLLAGCVLAAWLITPATRLVQKHGAVSGDGEGEPPARAPVELWSHPAPRLFASAAIALALYKLTTGATWWTPAALVAMSVRNIWMSWHERRHGYMWISAATTAVAASVWWLGWGRAASSTTGLGELFELVWVNCIAIALVAVVSAWVEHRRSPAIVATQRFRGVKTIGFHRFAVWLLIATLLLTTGLGLWSDVEGRPISASGVLNWGAWLATVGATISTWWICSARRRVATAYCVGLVGVGIYLDGLDFAPPMSHWALANGLAAYALATSYLWSRRTEIRAVLGRLGVPSEGDVETAATPGEWHASDDDSRSARGQGDGHGWLLAANGILATLVVALVVLVQVTMDDFPRRMIAAYAVGALGVATALLARGAVRSPLKYLALTFGVLFAVAFGWSWIAPDHPLPWLHRVVVSAVAVAVSAVVYGFGLVKLLRRENEWTRAAARLVPVLAAMATTLLVVVLAMETVTFVNRREVALSWPALLAVGAALFGLCAASLVAALLPGRDPLGLSERGRTAYVYAAEALAALLFLHIRITMPWLFSGWFTRFWPLVVMGIAFLGVALGEAFERRRRRILSEPLRTTGALLPLLPVIGFWFVASEIHYSSLLLAIGALYGALAVLRRSYLFGILAALSTNGALWYLLFRSEGLGFLEHPQLWLIPPALCTLVAAYLNRDRLSPEQSAAIRYAAAITIYASSTADIFISGVADAPWLPAVLAGLAIAGVFAGILLRIRAFLYLGTSFLCVAILTVIWYAGVEREQTYIIWIAGIVVGVAILVLLGIFEKRRDEVLRLVDEVKQWQA